MQSQTTFSIRNYFSNRLRLSLILPSAIMMAMLMETSAQNIVIIESESYNPGHVMDNVWLGVANNMGMTAAIYPQSTLYDSTFFSGTDALIIASGAITLTNSQITTITWFMQSGKSIYLQGEYDCTVYNTNITFENLVNTYGGSFTLNGIVSGTLAPMDVLGTLATNPNSITPLSYFWYGCNGTTCSYVEPFLQYSGNYFGFIFCSPTSDYGRIVYTSDQDWINQSISLPLLENILTLITSNNYQCSGANYLGANLGADTTICEDSVYVLQGGSSGFTYLWSTGATDTSIVVNAAGTYWVEASNGLCTTSDTVVISTIPCNGLPASFAASDTTICEKFCIDFHDSSANNPVSWLWNFPGGNPATSTDQNPLNVCYENPGVYDVTLVATDANGNSDTITLADYITVYTNPFAPVITQTGNVLTSTPATSYQWQLNSVDIPGATNQSYTITQSGLYTVIIGDENGCSAQASADASYVGISETNESSSVYVFPNPATDELIVGWFNGSVAREITIGLTNTLGQKVYSSEVFADAPTFKQTIDVTSLTEGVYFITIQSGQFSLVKKVMVGKD